MRRPMRLGYINDAGLQALDAGVDSGHGYHWRSDTSNGRFIGRAGMGRGRQWFTRHGPMPTSLSVGRVRCHFARATMQALAFTIGFRFGPDVDFKHGGGRTFHKEAQEGRRWGFHTGAKPLVKVSEKGR